MSSTKERIKQCVHCGKTFEDNTRPRNKKTCSKECARLNKNARERKEYREENPPKPNQRQLYYYNHYEYSFWLKEEIARNQMWKEAVPHDPNKIQSIISARELLEYHGGRKRRQEAVPFNGDEKGSHGVSVKFVESDREPSEVTTYKMTPKELEEYLSKKGRKI